MPRRRKKRSTKGSRKFSGERFSLGPHGYTKDQAKREAKRVRKHGKLRIRVAKVGKGRGSWQRINDVLRHPKSFKLSCSRCNRT